jgi:acetolactate synthase-1/2/3 large subunit
MNGAESLVRTLLACGVDTCFANPGTSEMHFVAALDRAPGMRCVLGLFEGVVTGAADAYARMTGKPAVTLLHCGPGLANGLSNLHNAKRAHAPIVNIPGDQATYHSAFDPPLASDIEEWARQVSLWVKRVARTEDLGAAAAEAVRASYSGPGGIATLILPSDVSWGAGGIPGTPLPLPRRPRVSEEALEEAAHALGSGEPAVLLMADAALSAEALASAHRIAAATGARLMAPTFVTRFARGRGRPPVDLVPYNVDRAAEVFAGTRYLILVGAGEPVGFFAYPGKAQNATPEDTAVQYLARPEDDLPDALERLADRLNCPAAPMSDVPPPRPASGALTPEKAAATFAALLPENAVVTDEAISLGPPFSAATRSAAPHEWVAIMGGAIGGGLPLAVGAGVGAPGRRVVALQADGSAMYSVQSLWTCARENLDVTVVILANRQYAILFKELADVGAEPGRNARDMFELSRPDLDWVRMAESMGVEAARAESCESFADLLRHANNRRGPFLIELPL